VAASGWKLLDNGTYIRIYDARTTAKTSGAATGSGSVRTGSADFDISRTGSGSGSVRTGSGSADLDLSRAGARGQAGEASSTYDSGWELQPDGSYRRRQETYSSYSSGSGSGRGSARGSIDQQVSTILL
jgi:hypothetical protein